MRYSASRQMRGDSEILTAIEHGLWTALIAASILVAMVVVGTGLAALLDTVADKLIPPP